MGMRVMFYEMPEKGILEHIYEYWNEFKAILIDMPLEEEINPKVLDFVLHKDIDLHILKNQDSQFLDQILEVFFEYTDGEKFDLSWVEEFPCLYVRNHRADFEWIKNNASSSLVQLWSYVLKGRSMDDISYLIKTEECYHQGFFTEEECQQMYNEFLSIKNRESYSSFGGISSFLEAIENKNNNGVVFIVN